MNLIKLRAGPRLLPALQAQELLQAVEVFRLSQWNGLSLA